MKRLCIDQDCDGERDLKQKTKNSPQSNSEGLYQTDSYKSVGPVKRAYNG